MKFDIQYTKDDILKLISNDIYERFGVVFELKDINFEVITKQNYRSAEWERGDFKANINLNK